MARAAKFWVPLLALVLCAGCATGRNTRPVLEEYRLRTAAPGALSQPVWLADSTGDELGGTLSPDGKYLAVAIEQRGNLDIWVKDLTNGVPLRVTHHVAGDTQPAWSPDGKALVFVSMRHDVKGDLYLWRAGEALKRLTKRETAEGHPAFAPDREALYLAAGPEGRTRIERLALASGQRVPITSWGTDHPCPSPDGRLLAYTRFDARGRGVVAVRALSGGAERLLTSGDYHAGFPTFSPDGRRLIYVRFDSVPPGGMLQGEPPASLWGVDLHRAMATSDGAAAEALATPLTSGRYTALFPQLHANGLVYTTRRAGGLDIGLLPVGGAVPRLGSPADQLALAMTISNRRDRLLGLARVAAMGRGPEASLALYEAAGIHQQLGERRQAAALFKQLEQESALTHGIYAQLAGIDLAAMFARDPAPSHQPQERAQRLKAALARLDALPLPTTPAPRVAAHLLLRRGDLYRLGADVSRALDAYETLLREHPAEKSEGAEASFRLGELLSRSRAARLMTSYYLSLARRYPGQEMWRRRAARAALTLWRSPDNPAQELEQLRTLVERHRQHTLFCTLARARMATLWEKQGELELAIEALHGVASRVTAATAQDAARAAFELGRLALELSEKLRKAGRLSRALTFYDKALTAYEALMKRHPPGHDSHTRARRLFLRLALLDAAQREREGELALAEKRYRRILKVQPALLQPHRRLISLAMARGEGVSLMRDYRQRIKRDPGDAAGHYGLGYLATFKQALDEDDLKEAARHLEQAASLAPRSPFPHMTMGWVLEMRERLLGQTRRGWLEDAITRYEQALGLNDQELDIQAEADVRLNLCGAYASLGNGWKQAFQYCSERASLKVPFDSRARQAMYHLTYGRAATALSHYELASRQLEQALELASDLGNKGLEAEVVARLALTAHLRGDLQASNRYFARAVRHHKTSAAGHPELLAGLHRTVAYNLALEGKPREARAALDRAASALASTGALTIEEMTRIGPAGRTTAPFGFNAPDERYLALAIRGLTREQDQVWPEVVTLLQQRVANRRQAVAARKDEELQRELGLLQGSLAMAKLRLGQRPEFRRAMSRAHRELAANAELVPSLALLVGLALNEAEELLSLPAGERPAADVARVMVRLEALERRRASTSNRGGEPALPARLRLALWTDLALLSLDAPPAPAPASASASASGDPARSARQTVDNLLRLTAPLTRAQRLLRQVFTATSPGKSDQGSEAEDAPAAQGVLAPLLQPLSAAEGLRWHVLAGLNLARISATFTPASRRDKHPTSDLLRRLEQLSVTHELGDLRYLVAAELAHRGRDSRAMKAAVDGLLESAPPWLLEPAYAARARDVRGLAFGLAQDLALALDLPLDALAWAEQRERRALVDQLWQLPLAGWGRAAAPVKALRQAARAHGLVLARQAPDADETSRKSWRGELRASEAEVRARLEALAATSPQVADLLQVGAFPREAVLGALSPGDQIVTLLDGGGPGTAAALLSLMPGTPPRLVRLKSTANALRRGAREGLAGVEQLLGKKLRDLTRGASRVFVDLGRISPRLSAERMLSGRPVVRLATLWELADAHPLRIPTLAGGVLADPDRRRARALARTLGLRPLTGKALTPGRLDLPLERANVVVWSGPIRHDGGSPANLRLLLSDRKSTRLNDLRLPRALGLPLRGHLLTVLLSGGDEQLTRRAERVALCRLTHAMGIPTLALLQGKSMAGSSIGRLLRNLISAERDHDLARAVSSAGSSSGELQLYGHPGLNKEDARALAARELKPTVMGGIKAFKQRRYPQVAASLERALRLMTHVGSEKYLDGSLLYLANSYTFLKDLRRAVPMLERLLAHRGGQVKQARQMVSAATDTAALKEANKTLLKAQARQVKALMLMGWLRLRNEQFDRALTINSQAIALYKEVGRPGLALGAYQQRAIIADKRGDYDEALSNARLALETARATLSRSRKKDGARLKVAANALEVARLERTRFSRFAPATRAARLALEQLDLLPAAARKATASERLAALIEVCRIQGARGNFGQAVEQARQARRLAREAGISGEDTALLEEVNNLFFLGALGQSLQAAAQGLRLAGKDRLRQLQFLNARGSALAALGRTDQALEALGEALRIARALGQEGEVAVSHNNIGNALRLGGRYAEAKAQFQAALVIDQRREDQLGVAVDRANLGLAELLLGRARAARQELTTAARLSRKIGAPMGELKALVGLARLELMASEPAAALKQARRGLELSGQRGLRNWRWRFHLLAARAQRAQGKVEAAQRELRQGVTLVQDRPPRPGRAPGSPEVEETEQDLYDELVDLLAQAGQAEAALEASEALRARAFVDQVSQGAAEDPRREKVSRREGRGARMARREEGAYPAVRSRRATPPGEMDRPSELTDSSGAGPNLPLEQARALSKRVTDLQGELAAARAAMLRAAAGETKSEGEAAAGEVGRLERALAAAGRDLGALNPWLPGLVLARGPTLTQLKPALARLGETQVVYYHPTRRRLLVWLLDKGGLVTMKRVAVTRAKLRQAVGQYRRALLAFHDTRAGAQRLHRWLLAPLAGQLKAQRLLVAPADVLHLVPFSALHDGKDHEVARRTISYLSDLASLEQLDRANPASAAQPGPWLSFAWSGAGSRPLTFAAREGQALAQAWPGTRLITAREATAERFRREAPSAGRIHLATHANMNERAPMQSALDLYGGPLPLLEVLGLRLTASLVILSACETGRGHLDSAGSVVGLNRAFLAAGARQVVSTLFRVSDLGSALLMKHFFRQLQRHAPAQALRRAQLHLRQRYAHPAFWAGFRLDGAP